MAARIALRNAWQSQNIGDIAHYLGLFELVDRGGMDPADFWLWAAVMDDGADDLLAQKWPQVEWLASDAPGLEDRLRGSDFLLHGSSAGFRAAEMRRWQELTGKPYGVLGISFPTARPDAVATMSDAEFVFFRDSESLAIAREAGVAAPIMEWGPDAAFAVTGAADDAAAADYVASIGLSPGRFLCCIPRYRRTPFWRVRSGYAADPEVEAVNAELADHDHAPHRETIIRLVRELGMSVLITCEDQTQIPLGREQLYDPLPDDVKAKVVWRDSYWLPPLALGVYKLSAGLFGNEMHSPIMCIANGVPATVGRWDRQGPKGYMWRDIGLDEWLFDLDDEAQVGTMADTVLQIASDPDSARHRVAGAQQIVARAQQRELEVLRAAVG